MRMQSLWLSTGPVLESLIWVLNDSSQRRSNIDTFFNAILMPVQHAPK